MQNYIFGYGSLIEEASRTRTTPDAKNAYPVKIKGFQRGWFARTGDVGLSTTYLGCIQHTDSYTNGVVYKVSKEDLEKTDAREKGYKRVQILSENIQDLAGKLEKDAIVWIYANIFPNDEIPKSDLPSKDFPIVQSYVDICINGCLEIESLFPNVKNFAKDFVESTTYWNEHWANDRIYPRRPFIYRKNAYTIDKVLKENLLDKSLFNKIYIE